MQGRMPGAGLGDAEEADEVEEVDRGALGPFLLLALIEVEEDDEEASQMTAEHARWWLSPLSSGTRARRRWWIEVLGDERAEEGGSSPARAPGRGPATCRLRTTWPKSLPAHARDGTSPQVGGPPRPRPGPGVDSLRPEAARTSSCGGFGTLLGRNNREAWGEWVQLIPRLTPRPASPASPCEAISRGRGERQALARSSSFHHLLPPALFLQ